MKTRPADFSTGIDLPAEIQARFWCAPQQLGVDDADPRLWVHLADGRVLAIRWYKGRLRDDSLLAALFSALKDDLRGSCHELSLPGFGEIQLLYAAPAIPAPIRQGVFPESLCMAARDFSRCLDHEVLDFLAALGRQRFFASIRNYNRLATLEPELRQRRLQALYRFPALVVPILLTQHHSPNLCSGKRHAWRLPAPEVEAAMDAGRDLTGALASHYDISRGLVRASLNRLFWETGDEKQRALLHFFDILPANKRPDAETLLRDWSLLLAYRFLFESNIENMDEMVARQASPELLAAAHLRVFRNGWEATWAMCRHRGENPRALLVDCRDFLAAAGRRAAEFLKRRYPLPIYLLAAAWLAEFGLANLLDASRRWHQRQPAATSVKIATLDFRLPALIGELVEDRRKARELLTAAELAQEGTEMQHCVASYWEYCLDGDRIFALSMPMGERATAQYKGSAANDTYRLVQLRGFRNAEPAPELTVFARWLEDLLNAQACSEKRRAAWNARAIYEAMRREAGCFPARQRRSTFWPEDERSERQLETVLRRLSLAPMDTDACCRAYVAGYAHYEGEQLETRMEPGQALMLIREEENPHDPLAIALAWEGHKLGYVPRPENREIARRLGAGETLSARILHLDPEAPVWLRLEFVIVACVPDESGERQ